MQLPSDWLFHVIELVVIGSPLWWGLFRIIAIQKDFPPHRHGKDVRDITYPRGYAPGETVRLNGRDA